MPSRKEAISRALFSLSGFDRIHIIGCSRSGTTMLHLAMACFSNVMLSGSETRIQNPYLRERTILALRHGWRPNRKHYVTKRAFGWFKPDQLDLLAQHTRFENIGLIHLVRDPRDVILSRHAGSKSEAAGSAYVTDEHWYDSIAAADRLFEGLADHRRKLTLRYEDLVLDPLRAERQIADAFGLERNPKALPIDRVKDNFERLNIRFGREGIQALNGLRNMDSRSIARWRQNPTTTPFETGNSKIRARFEVFCAEHGYV